MNIAVIGEEWESAFVRETVASLRDAPIDPSGSLIVPEELASGVADVTPRRIVPVARGDGGYQSLEAIRQRISAVTPSESLLTLYAGAVPVGGTDRVELNGSSVSPGVFEWCPATASGPVLIPGFQRPQHVRHPRIEARFDVSPNGTPIATVLDGKDYFTALGEGARAAAQPIWNAYGPARPVFAINTNEFREPPVEAHDDYFILGSGLLGLRLIVEGRPRPGARVFVYDINPHQHEWIRHTLRNVESHAELEDLIDAFARARPTAHVREVMPHERENAELQHAWYRRHRIDIARIARCLEWHYVLADIWNRPHRLFDLVAPDRTTLLMYLDLFVVWRFDGNAPRIEHYAGIASGFETAIRSRATAGVTFVPGPHSEPVQARLTAVNREPTR